MEKAYHLGWALILWKLLSFPVSSLFLMVLVSRCELSDTVSMPCLPACFCISHHDACGTILCNSKNPINSFLCKKTKKFMNLVLEGCHYPWMIFVLYCVKWWCYLFHPLLLHWTHFIEDKYMDDFVFSCAKWVWWHLFYLTARLNRSFQNCNNCFYMHKNLCLKAAKYTQIQTASVFVSVCHRRILTHLVFEDPQPRDLHTQLAYVYA